MGDFLVAFSPTLASTTNRKDTGEESETVPQCPKVVRCRETRMRSRKTTVELCSIVERCRSMECLPKWSEQNYCGRGTSGSNRGITIRPGLTPRKLRQYGDGGGVCVRSLQDASDGSCSLPVSGCSWGHFPRGKTLPTLYDCFVLQCDKCVYCVFGGAKTVTDKLLSRRNCKDSILIRVWTLFPKYDVVYNVLDRFLGKCLEGDSNRCNYPYYWCCQFPLHTVDSIYSEKVKLINEPMMTLEPRWRSLSLPTPSKNVLSHCVNLFGIYGRCAVIAL